MSTEQRSPEHQRNSRLEALLATLTAAIGPGGDALAQAHSTPKLPVYLICGTPRSGTTMSMAWLARAGTFEVPTNLISRFYRAPAVGAAVHRLLADPSVDHQTELLLPPEILDPAPYTNQLGKTRGPGAPNEFWYFWRYFLGFSDPPALGDLGRARADVAAFCGQLGAWEAVAGRPIALKALIASWDLDWLAAVLPTARFIRLRRDGPATMRSLLGARRRFYGTEEAWYSFRLPGPLAEGLSPLQQVAAQVRCMDAAIDAGLARVAPERILTLDYDDLCSKPQEAWDQLRAFAARDGVQLPDAHPDQPSPFRVTRREPDPEAEAAWAESALIPRP